MDQDPLSHAEVDRVYRQNIERLVERGAFTPPAHDFEGARYFPPDDLQPAESWKQAKRLWEKDDADG